MATYGGVCFLRKNYSITGKSCFGPFKICPKSPFLFVFSNAFSGDELETYLQKLGETISNTNTEFLVLDLLPSYWSRFWKNEQSLVLSSFWHFKSWSHFKSTFGEAGWKPMAYSEPQEKTESEYQIYFHLVLDKVSQKAAKPNVFSFCDIQLDGSCCWFWYKNDPKFRILNEMTGSRL